MSVTAVALTGRARTGVEPQLMMAAGLTQPLPSVVRLGRLPPDPGTPQAPLLKKYFSRDRMTAAALPAATNRRATASASLTRVYMNDRLGCCVISGKFHAVGLWTGADAPAVAVGTDNEIVQQYRSICGPGDNGCVITRVLDVMRARGLALSGVPHKIDGYVAVDWTDELETKVALYLFGACTIGIDLPQAWTESDVWDVTGSQLVGGHDVTPVDYGPDGVYVSSWGRVYLITWRAWRSRSYLREFYAILSPDWYGPDRMAPCGVDADRLKQDLDTLGGGSVPTIDPTPPPPPPEPVTPPSPAPGPVLPPFPEHPTFQNVLAWLVQVYFILHPAAQDTAAAHDVLASVPWPLVLMILADAAVVVPVVLTDLQAGKSWNEVIIDVLAALKSQGGGITP